MKVVLMGTETRQTKFGYDIDIKGAELIPVAADASPADLAAKAADAEYAVIDAISLFTAEHMDAMPKLKLIHSEGVSINKIDTAAAADRGIIVCSNKGANAVSVADKVLNLWVDSKVQEAAVCKTIDILNHL